VELTIVGKKVYAYTAGRPLDPQRPSIVFVHGAANDHSAFLLQSRYFAYHGCNALAVDLPGHGRSGGSPLATIAAIGDWLAAFLDATKIGEAALVGHSMGSLGSLECAARYPTRVSKLALIATSAPMLVGEALLSAAHADAHDAIDMLNIWGHSPSARLGGNTAPGMWMTGANMRLLERAQVGTLYIDLKACNEYRDGPATAAKVKCPVLFVLGSHDMLTPTRGARGLQSTIPDAQTVILEGAGHALMTEQPDAVLDALIDFVVASP